MTDIKKIKRIALTTAIAAPAAFAFAAAAHADPTSSPFSAQIGGSFLTDSNAQKAVAHDGFSVGLNYALSTNKTTDSSGTPSIDLDYDSSSGHGNHINTFGLFLADRINLSQSKTGGSGVVPYVGAGIGLADIQGAGNHKSTNGYTTVTTHYSKTATNFAGKILAGLAFGQQFVEVSYQINGDVEHVNADTIDLTIGTHF